MNPPASSKDFPLTTVRPHNGAPTLVVNGEPVFPLLLMTSPEAMKEMKSIVACPIHLVSDIFPLGWTGVGRHEFGEFDKGL